MRIVLISAGLLSVAVILERFGRRRLDAVAVRGGSMAPTLLSGEFVLVVRLNRPPRPGEIVVVADPRHPRREIIKRVLAVQGAAVELAGDATEASTDSRAFGPVQAMDIQWRGVLRYWPPRRAALLNHRPPAVQCRSS